jgi:hypothetical protein
VIQPIAHWPVFEGFGQLLQRRRHQPLAERVLKLREAERNLVGQTQAQAIVRQLCHVDRGVGRPFGQRF